MKKAETEKLTKGKELYVKGEYEKTFYDGSIGVRIEDENENKQLFFTVDKNVFLYNPMVSETVLENKPKYDPSRPFRNGDIVRYVERDGRSYVDAPPVGATCCVCVGEDSVGMVSVEFKFSGNEEPAVHDVPWYHLQLITPVEELEPYSVVETMSHDGWQIVRDGLPLAIYDARRHPHAKAAAEAERDRLNAEYRKEQNNEHST